MLQVQRLVILNVQVSIDGSSYFPLGDLSASLSLNIIENKYSNLINNLYQTTVLHKPLLRKDVLVSYTTLARLVGIEIVLILPSLYSYVVHTS